MSVWLPRRPPSSAPFILRQLAPHRTLHVLASRNSHLLVVEKTIQPRQVGATRRWQSTKETTSAGSGETRVATESKSSSTSVAPKDDTVKEPLGTRVWKKVKHEAAHYWSGTKLLVSEVRISARLQWKILHGEALTRRERRQVSTVILCALNPRLIYPQFS